MTKVPISKTKIETKLAIIRDALTELELIAKLTKTDFLKDKMKFIASEHFLRRALEAIFDISGHIISRFPYSPGKRPTTYKEIAIAMGDKRIVSQEFAKNSLLKMAGYRNRMAHYYDEITKEELFEIIKNKLGDIDIFAQKIVNVFENPQKYGLEINDL